MHIPKDGEAAASEKMRRLFVFNGGFLTQKRVRRILELAGFDIKIGVPGADDLVGVWGNSPTAHRGEAVASRRTAGLVRIEDAWLRSLHPGRSGSPPMGLAIDLSGVHYDAAQPSDLETLLATHLLDDTALLDRARGAIERMQEAHLTKYAAVDPDEPVPPPGYVLIVDQTAGDASVTASGADRNRFLEMLVVAQEEHPGARIVIKTHPETRLGHRKGHFEHADLNNHITLTNSPVSPWPLLEGAIAVYTVSSQLGYEAIFAGHKPRVFGQPFYAGWGLTEDEVPIARRQRKLSRAQLFAAASLMYPTWYDPFQDRLCSYETAAETLAAQARSWREDRNGWVASRMRLWKRGPIQKTFGAHVPVVFEDKPDITHHLGKRHMVWASKASEEHADFVRVEDGFLRSKGLGAELVPALSLVTDDLGIYYDASRPSRLENLIASREKLRSDQTARAEALIKSITHAGLTKYNLGGDRPDLPKGHRILVVGQVEDDASLALGGGETRSNAALLERTRALNPDACLIYKPHPDVEAGLRDGETHIEGLSDWVASKADPAFLLAHVNEVWTMTSLLGFEALIRGVPVTTLGVPFYAGWGLTRDLAKIPPRRRARPQLNGLVHACLIDYPRYIHPDSAASCSVETAIDWLANANRIHRRSASNRLLAKLQGIFASQARLWR